jgi:glycosyltransferase involved in cell wall biosynthesis
MKDFKVDILMITYNHQDFIEQAIDGVISQVTNFKFRLQIFDDCSTDNTEEKIKKKLNHSNLNLTIVYHRNQHNLGVFENGKKSLNSINSDYVALCEGDDYWIEPCKLQIQVDFLESNPEYSICFTNVFELKENNLVDSKINSIIGNDKDYIASLNNFLTPYFFYTSSCVFRNIIDFSFLDDYKTFKDIFLISSLLKCGDLYLINKLCSVYRIHESGIWSMHPKVKNLIENTNTFEDMVKYHKYKVSIINESYLWGLIELNYTEAVSNRIRINCFIKFIKFCIRNPKYFKLLKKDFLRI